jgi:hypothetical protein
MEAMGEQAPEKLEDQIFIDLQVSSNRITSRRMLKKADQQGRRRVETGGVPSGVR